MMNLVFSIFFFFQIKPFSLIIVYFILYFQANEGKLVRIYLTIILMGQTVISPAAKGRELTRDDITCKITYCAVGKYS